MGFRVALVSDAGTPTISDPGFKLTAKAHSEGIAVEALPGPCAVTTALSASGFPAESFCFLGYLPKVNSEKTALVIRASKLGQTTVFYDSPNRIAKSLAVISEIMGPEHVVFLGVELTKMHETHFRGQVGKVLEEIMELTESARLKGELTLVVAPGTDVQSEMETLAKGTGFDPTNESEVKCNILKVAETLDLQIEMSE